MPNDQLTPMEFESIVEAAVNEPETVDHDDLILAYNYAVTRCTEFGRKADKLFAVLTEDALEESIDLEAADHDYLQDAHPSILP